MQFGVSLPPFEHFADPQLLISLGRRAENAGWDGFFLWDHIVRDFDCPIADPWVALAAVATHTHRIRLGTLVTPVARRRPWVLARQALTLDHLSNGRLILGVGLGSRAEIEFTPFGEPGEDRTRAQKLDEGLDILAGLWSGESFRYDGQHYHLDGVRFLPRPVRHIPIWVAGHWPHKPPMRRAARWDGACPEGAQGRVLTVDEWREIVPFVRDLRSSDALFDFVHFNGAPTYDPAAAAEQAAAYADVGVTWWIEYIAPRVLGLPSNQSWPDDLVRQLIHRLEQGPPRTV